VRKNRPVETFSRAYDAASPNQQAALRAWMRDIILPRKQRRKDIIRSLRSEKNSIAARDRRILEFPLSMSPNAVAKILRAEGWYSPKTTIYHIEFRVRRLRERSHPEAQGLSLAPRALNSFSQSE
jgi:hypothetical protein